MPTKADTTSAAQSHPETPPDPASGRASTPAGWLPPLPTRRPIGLTGVSSVTGTAHLKSVLSAIATGTTGIKTSYLKNYYDSQARAAVVQKMRALRATELATIEDNTHMKAGVTEYSLEAGLADIEAYYNAGT